MKHRADGKFDSMVSVVVLVFALALAALDAAAAPPRPVLTRGALVAGPEPMASNIGLQIIEQGGNAVDAAVALSFALAVTHPAAGNIGGGGFLVYVTADGSQATSFDYRETAPALADRDMYLDDQGEFIKEKSTVGAMAVGIPGSVRGLELAHQRFGVLPWHVLVEPAIELARQGFSLPYSLQTSLASNMRYWRLFPTSLEVFTSAGEPFTVGARWRQPMLAEALEIIATKGSQGFYEGPVAEAIVRTIGKHGGVISLEDLKNYRALQRQLLRGKYRHNYEILSMGPPSSGGLVLIQMLNMIERFDVEHMGHNSAQYVHLLAETMRRAFEDRASFMGDSDFVSVPVQGLLAKQYAARQIGNFDPAAATPSVKLADIDPWKYESHETTHFTIVDRDGNVVACTTTLNGGFGSKLACEKYGFLLNNEMDDFSAKPGAPNIYGLIGAEANAIAPGKRMLSSMTPTVVLKDGKVWLAAGSPGGPTIINTVLQIILNSIDFKMNIAEAISQPRIHHQAIPDVLLLEKNSFTKDTTRILEKMGHNLRIGGYIGDAQGIKIPTDGQPRQGASDPRRYGLTVGELK